MGMSLRPCHLHHEVVHSLGVKIWTTAWFPEMAQREPVVLVCRHRSLLVRPVS